ncbi:MAG: hypothetical protein MJ060_04670, partial [Clostridia bacterium]|nr:hypothetical protein [Clostridia bacterium]
SLLDSLIPGYIKEGKQQLAIAIGCTGGQHRSVTIAEATGDYLKSKGYRVSVAHRDLAMAVAKASGKSVINPEFLNTSSQKTAVMDPDGTVSFKPINA